MREAATTSKTEIGKQLMLHVHRFAARVQYCYRCLMSSIQKDALYVNYDHSARVADENDRTPL
jgi:hypothetical protein